jgi:ADP-ribose pyrophosphatase
MRTIIPTGSTLVPKQAVCVFKGMIFDTYQWDQELYDGTFKTFEMLKRPDTLVIIAVKDDKIIILDEEQPNLNQFYDIPGGMHDYDVEDELTAAKRELVEETGMTFKTWKLLAVVQHSKKIEQFLYTFLATDFEDQVPQKLDAGEKIKVMELSFDEAKKLLLSKKGRGNYEVIRNAISLASLLTTPVFEDFQQSE